MSIRQVSCAVRGAACVALGAACVALGAHQAPVPVTGIEAALDLYAKGRHAEAVDVRPLDGIAVPDVLERIERWAGPASGPDAAAALGRRRVAARLVVDAIASKSFSAMWFGVAAGDGLLLGNSLRISGAGPPAVPSMPQETAVLGLVAWACRQMPSTGTVEPWESWWWMTSIAVLQEAGEWGALLGDRDVIYSNNRPPGWQQAERDEVRVGHLAEARARIGAHPRLRLAEAVARAAAVTDATRRFTRGASVRLLFVRGRFDVLRNLEEGARRINSGVFTAVERDLTALLDEPGFEGEVALRLALLRLLQRDWARARQWLDRSAQATDDTIWLATGDYFRGWIHERTNRPAEALAAYRAAHARYPQSPNLNMLLATQLLLAGERTQAAALVEAPMREQYNVGWRDLYHVLISGDARLARDHAMRMREAR